MHVLLVEPDYYTRYPPLGLLKLASYHRSLGDSVELVRGVGLPRQRPERICVTSLFTWSWKEVWEAVNHYKALFPRVPVWLGGIYASLMPEHAALSGADYVHVGRLEDCESLTPAYDLVPQWRWSIIFASRGCRNRCPFCAVPKLEGELNSLRFTIKDLVYPGHSRVVFWDNNILAASNWKAVTDEVRQLGLEVDFNQGIDAALITDEAADRLSTLKVPCVRLSYDYKGKGPLVRRAVESLISRGMRARKIFVYVLYNFEDTPDDFFARVRDVLNWGAVVFPMRFEPLNSLARNSHLSPAWNEARLQMIEKVRRVLGYGGTLPPYSYLVKRFNEAANFDDAFREPEHLFDGGDKKRAHRAYNAVWRGYERDWRNALAHFQTKVWS